jgi:hypothetical protein
VREFWEGFEQKDKRQQAAEVESVLNKADSFALPLPLKLIFGQPTSTLDFKDIIDKRRVLLVDLSGMGTDPAKHLGAMIISQFRIAATRALPDEELEKLPPFELIIDEFEKYIQHGLPDLLSEVRKMKLSLVLAHQFMGQLEEELQQAVLGNVRHNRRFPSRLFPSRLSRRTNHCRSH